MAERTKDFPIRDSKDAEKLRKSVEEAEVARAAESGVIAFEGDDWSDEEILLLLELV